MWGLVIYAFNFKNLPKELLLFKKRLSVCMHKHTQERACACMHVACVCACVCAGSVCMCVLDFLGKWNLQNESILKGDLLE